MDKEHYNYLHRLFADTKESFIAKYKARFGNETNYILDDIEYYNSHTPIYPICKIHGRFKIMPYKLLQGQGCSKCKSSHLENEIRSFLQMNNIEFEEQKTFPWSKEGRKIFKYDFFLNDYNCLIECQGKQHFRLGGWTKNKEKKEITFNDIERRDKEKLELAKLNKIKLFYYSNLHIEYPYKVYEDKEQLLSDILSFYKENINI